MNYQYVETKEILNRNKSKKEIKIYFLNNNEIYEDESRKRKMKIEEYIEKMEVEEVPKTVQKQVGTPEEHWGHYKREK